MVSVDVKHHVYLLTGLACSIMIILVIVVSQKGNRKNKEKEEEEYWPVTIHSVTQGF